MLGSNAKDLRRALSRVPLGDSGALQYRRRCLRPLGRARAAAALRSCMCMPTAAASSVSYGALARDLEPACQCAARARRQARRPRRDPAAAGAGGRGRPYRDLQARRHRAAARDAVRAGRAAYRLQNSGAKALLTNAQGSASSPRSARKSPRRRLVLSIDGAVDGAQISPICWRARRPTSRRTTPRRTIRR